MKIKEFFKGKRFMFCFIAYVLLTAFIIATSLTEATESKKQSNFVSTVFSNVVEFITGGNVNLSANGKTDDYPKSIQLNNVPNRELKVGESFNLSYGYEGGKDYSFLTPSYYSTNSEILNVNSKTGEVKVLNKGKASIGVKEEKSNVDSKVEVTVGNGVYVPTLTVSKGIAESNGNYYFSPSNSVGSLYYIYIDSEIDENSLTVSSTNSDAFQFIKSKSMIAFLTKKVGSFDIVVSGKYFNVNSLENGNEQTLTKIFSVNVESHLLNKPTLDFSFKNNLIEVYKGDKTKIEFFNDRHAQSDAILKSQRTLLHTYNRNDLTVKSENGNLFITPNSVGSFEYKVLYSDGVSIKTATLNVNSLQKRPISPEMKSTNKNVVLEMYSYLTIVSNGETLDANEFVWSSSNKNIATVDNGKVMGHDFGKVTITATSKTYNDVVIEKTFKVVPSYEYVIRKVFGHFLLFSLLAFFAKIVYFKRAKVMDVNKTTFFAMLFTVLAGLITASIGEILQLDVFVSERSFSLVDIFINFGGYIFGFLITLLIFYLILKRKNKKV